MLAVVNSELVVIFVVCKLLALSSIARELIVDVFCNVATDDELYFSVKSKVEDATASVVSVENVADIVAAEVSTVDLSVVVRNSDDVVGSGPGVEVKGIVAVIELGIVTDIVDNGSVISTEEDGKCVEVSGEVMCEVLVLWLSTLDETVVAVSVVSATNDKKQAQHYVLVQ